MFKDFCIEEAVRMELECVDFERGRGFWLPLCISMTPLTCEAKYVPGSSITETYGLSPRVVGRSMDFGAEKNYKGMIEVVK